MKSSQYLAAVVTLTLFLIGQSAVAETAPMPNEAQLQGQQNKEIYIYDEDSGEWLLVAVPTLNDEENFSNYESIPVGKIEYISTRRPKISGACDK